MAMRFLYLVAVLLASVSIHEVSAQQNPSACNGQLDLVFLVDASNSVLGFNFETQMTSLSNLAGQLDIRPGAIRVGTVVFSNAFTSMPLSDNKQAVINGIKQFDYLDEGTRTDLGIQEAMRLFRQSSRGALVPKLLLVITDGASTQPQATLEAARQAKELGISIYAIGITDAINENELRQIASSPTQVMLTPNFDNISRVLQQAVYQACSVIITTPRPVVTRPPPVVTAPPAIAHLCTGSGSMSAGGIGYVAHPTDCDKYIQCYYNANNPFHLAIIRHCPLGLHWHHASKTCDLPQKVKCPNDPCRDDCSPYAMSDSTRGYWMCKDNVSVGMCCGEFESFVPGTGCITDNSCAESCVIGKCANGYCRKRPLWSMPAMYDVQLAGGYLGWFPKTCNLRHFDILSCQCSAYEGHECTADFQQTFSTSFSADTPSPYLKAVGVTFDFSGARLTPGTLHLDTGKYDGSEPITLRFSYREDFAAGQDSNILLSSSHNCGLANSGSLLITYNNRMIRGEIQTALGLTATVTLPTTGFQLSDFKEVTFTYDQKYMAMSVKVRSLEYLEKVKAPRGISFPCGLDIGPTATHTGFRGVIQQLAFYSCSMYRLY